MNSSRIGGGGDPGERSRVWTLDGLNERGEVKGDRLMTGRMKGERFKVMDSSSIERKGDQGKGNMAREI